MKWHNVTAALYAAALILGLAALAECKTTTKPQSNAFGAVVYTQNPHVYLFGSVVAVSDMGGATNVRFNPARTFAFFSESVLFCGDVVDQFNAPGAIMVTYRRNPARLYQGVPCYELESVNKVQEKGLP